MADPIRLIHPAAEAGPQLPHNVEAEAALLGAIMIDNRENLGSDLQEAVAVTAQGLAEEVAGDGRDEWRALCLARHPALQAFADSPGCALIRIKVTSYVVVRCFQEVIEWRIDD